MNKDRQARQRIELLMKTVIGDDVNTGRCIHYWEWSQGVGLFGIAKAHQTTGNTSFLNFLEEWFSANAPRKVFGSVNCVIPCCAALYLYMVTKKECYREICDEYADWIKNRAVRTTNGGLAHVWSVGGLDDYKNQLWADSVFMAGIFMVGYGKFFKDEQMYKDGIKQFEIHVNSLYVPEKELFSHGYHCIDKKNLGAHWGRGNGWIVAALSEIFNILGDECPSEFKTVFKTVMNRAKSLVADNGMLRTLLDRADSYEEATASMLFGYAAVRGFEAGLLDESYFKWAEKIMQSLSFLENGSVCNASGGTDCQDAEGYYSIPFIQSSYIDGITLMFLSLFVKNEG